MKKLLFKWKMKYGEDNWRIKIFNWFTKGRS